MNHPAENIVVITKPPYNDPWKIYIGRSDQNIKQMSFIGETPVGGEFSPTYVAEMEDLLFQKHNIIVISPWVDDIECYVAYYSRA